MADPPWKKRLISVGPIGVALAFVLGKLKLLLPLLKLFKLTTLVTMLFAIWIYALYWGLPFAAGFVGLILIHESGHALAMHRIGMAAGAPVFIPFVGAFIAMKSQPRDAYVEASSASRDRSWAAWARCCASAWPGQRALSSGTLSRPPGSSSTCST